MKVKNIRRSPQKGSDAKAEAENIYRNLLIKISADRKSKATN